MSPRHSGGDWQGVHRVEPLQAAVAQEQQLRLATLQLRDVVHLAEGPCLVDVRVLYCAAAGA